jgi:hypothetical protein
LLLISALCVAADAVWSSLLGQPAALVNVFSSGSFSQHLLTSLWIISIVVRMACFARLAQLGLCLATNPFPKQIRPAAADSAKLRTTIEMSNAG